MSKGARSVIAKRAGPITDAEKDLVAKFVQDQPAEMTPAQTNALAKVLRRTKETTLNLIHEARERLVDNSKFYIDSHKVAVALAIQSDTVAGLEQAIKGSQWALENIAGEGVGILEKNNGTGSSGPRVMIGVNIGGMREPTVIDLPAPVVTVEKP
jgi:hypothetical protein